MTGTPIRVRQPGRVVRDYDVLIGVRKGKEGGWDR